jgi:DNA gyrase subunit B
VSTSTPAPRVNLLKEKDQNLQGEDIREGLTAIISVRLREPQFEGQTKGKLGNPPSRRSCRRPPTRSWPTGSRRTPPRPTRSSRRRSAPSAPEPRPAERPRRHPPQVGARRRRHARQAQGLLERNREECELFIVEGDSAGGSAIKAPRPAHQAILPIRGKILNVERARLDKMLKNNEIQALISAIGAGVGDEFDVDEDPLRQGHPAVRRRRRRQPHPHPAAHLLLPPHEGRWWRQRHVYIAQPPLYSTVVGKEKIYLKDDAAKNAFLAENPNHKKEFARLKGLGEMDWDELKATTMDAASRTLLQVTVEQAANADEPPSPR